MKDGQEDMLNGPDEGGKRGENTPFSEGYDRQPSEEGLKIDAAIQHETGDGEGAAGPNSDANTLTDDRPRDNRA